MTLDALLAQLPETIEAPGTTFRLQPPRWTDEVVKIGYGDGVIPPIELLFWNPGNWTEKGLADALMILREAVERQVRCYRHRIN